MSIRFINIKWKIALDLNIMPAHEIIVFRELLHLLLIRQVQGKRAAFSQFTCHGDVNVIKLSVREWLAWR